MSLEYILVQLEKNLRYTEPKYVRSEPPEYLRKRVGEIRRELKQVIHMVEVELHSRSIKPNPSVEVRLYPSGLL